MKSKAKKKKNKKSEYFNEAYRVKFKYQSGNLMVDQSKVVLVPVKHGVNEKNNHAEAERLLKEKIPFCTVVSVDYM